MNEKTSTGTLVMKQLPARDAACFAEDGSVNETAMRARLPDTPEALVEAEHAARAQFTAAQKRQTRLKLQGLAAATPRTESGSEPAKCLQEVEEKRDSSTHSSMQKIVVVSKRSPTAPAVDTASAAEVEGAQSRRRARKQQARQRPGQRQQRPRGRTAPVAPPTESTASTSPAAHAPLQSASSDQLRIRMQERSAVADLEGALEDEDERDEREGVSAEPLLSP